MFEPKLHDEKIGRGIALGKTLLRADKFVPVRVMNVNYFPVTWKKGTILGHCSSVSSVIRSVTSTISQPNNLPTELEKLVAISSKDIKPAQQPKLRDLVKKYQDIFDTGQGKGARRLPLAKKEEADKIVSDMGKEGVIEPSDSPWSSPVVLVKKKDGSTRFCVDYRQLNNVTKKDSYPLPRIDDTLDTLAGSTIFSTLDLKSGYWQVELAQEDREKTAFTIGSGLWQFTVMPFGLCNAPATFERLMETVLKGLSWNTCLVYLDDIIVVGRSFEDHVKNLEEVFLRLRNPGLKLSPKKCHLFQKEVRYLGHVVSGEGVATFTNFEVSLVYAHTIADMCWDSSNIAKPLTRLTGGQTKFQWSEECQDSFRKLKEALINAPVLSYPLPKGKFILDTDASNVGLGTVLSQIQEGQEKVIGYFSKTLSKPERNYCVTRRELLAVVKGVEHFYKYVYGRRFLLRTDHAALKWLLQFKNPEGQVARWIERLQEFDFEIEHRAGTSHKNADALREEATLCRTAAMDDNWNDSKIQKDQEKDPDLGLVVSWKKGNRRPSWQEVAGYSPAVKSYWAQWNSLILDNGILKRVLEADIGGEDRRQIIVPRNRREEVLREIHDGVAGGHLGVTKTLQKVRQRFYWANCQADVQDWCRKCAVCAASNGPRIRPKAPMRQYNVGSPFERIAIDIAGPFPVSDHGNKYILVAMDYFSKWAEAYALPNQEAITVADVLVKEWICRFGIPMELHSDQGRNFESQTFSKKYVYC
ncbi:hypothetical protein JTB14_011047 [Gonioctena quinquepunctata]|nr:hypothetical protein JTB14_011047 [Gonioctena quinquepunctata]